VLGLGSGVGLHVGASELLIADCRYAIHGDRVPFADA